MPSQLEGAMDALISVFYNYSGHDGDKYKLNKGELKQLLHTELTDFLTFPTASHPTQDGRKKDGLLITGVQSSFCCGYISHQSSPFGRHPPTSNGAVNGRSQKDPLLVEKIMSDLDSNKDNEVDFNEFVVLVAALTVACNDFFQEQKKKNPK
ncbi:protein S100-Z isoform X1 [Corythoichthys intestinalis]|uniref:protein S100-Z isoform X1 n=1 Tax=Corythoichthys intestinalis TaxID=161448 RepID=UPI0025A66CC3|nr:protein S100-Z isoform X1 [Corythoichthys intestinalis]